MKDEEIMELVARGDEIAFGGLYDKHKGTVSAHLWRLCGDPELTDEAVSETFVRVWRSARSFSTEKGSFKTWLMTVASNALRTLWRKQKPMESLPNSDVPDPSPGPDDRSIASVILGGVWNDLSFEHRQALSLRFFSSFSYGEIGEVQNVPIATARTRVFYGLKRLKKLLEDRK